MDASLIEADANKSRSIQGADIGRLEAIRAVKEYLQPVEDAQARRGVLWAQARAARGPTRLMLWWRTSIGSSARNKSPHIAIIDQSHREDGTFSREDFAFTLGFRTQVIRQM